MDFDSFSKIAASEFALIRAAPIIFLVAGGVLVLLVWRFFKWLYGDALARKDMAIGDRDRRLADLELLQTSKKASRFETPADRSDRPIVWEQPAVNDWVLAKLYLIQQTGRSGIDRNGLTLGFQPKVSGAQISEGIAAAERAAHISGDATGYSLTDAGRARVETLDADRYTHMHRIISFGFDDLFAHLALSD